MTLRESLRNLGYLLADFVPGQLVRVARGRDCDAAVLAAADALADEEAEYETLEAPPVDFSGYACKAPGPFSCLGCGDDFGTVAPCEYKPPVEVEPHPPVAPSAGFNLIDLITEVLTDHGIAYGECLAPVIAEALEARLAARLAPPK